MNNLDHILAKKNAIHQVALLQHLKDVASIAVLIAKHLNLPETIAFLGAILHDIGKASPVFQNTLKNDFSRPPGFVFRHEIASLFFLSSIDECYHPFVIDMVVAHHKSIYKDTSNNGLLDLIDSVPDCFEIHAQGFESWSPDAISILNNFGFNTKSISIQEARRSYEAVVSHCEQKTFGYSIWKGLLMAADHLASALPDGGSSISQKLFSSPNLKFYFRKSELFPLSFKSSDATCPHTIVTAPTGAGKTDFLLRRCRGRVFYVLPFQASINAMFERIKSDLQDTDAQIHLLHAASSIKINKTSIEEKILQKHVGSSIKILTPHQLASMVFGTKGYEILIADVKSSDIILDEIHTYTETIQSIVLKMVEILQSLNCRVHIGTATMPTVLYHKLLMTLGGPTNVSEIRLNDDVLDTYDRHKVFKLQDEVQVGKIIASALQDNQKILIVLNRVSHAQKFYQNLQNDYPGVKKMLIHSRFKRGRRNELETILKKDFNERSQECIVVSTQVVEVSLDISFDLMITAAAPIDSLVQRFGRINRKRSSQNLNKLKPVYVLPPPKSESDAKPYQLETLIKSYEILPDGAVLKENQLQAYLDFVYPTIKPIDIDLESVFNNGSWRIKELWHNPQSALLKELKIESVTCIVETDRYAYEHGDAAMQINMEIPVRYSAVAHSQLMQSDKGTRPFIVPTRAYSESLGLLISLAKSEYYSIQTYTSKSFVR